MNDLGRKSNAIRHLQQTIVVLRDTLKRDMTDVAAAVAARAPWKEDSMLLSLVSRCHEIYYERRRKVEEYGLEVMMRGRDEKVKHSNESGQT